MTSTVVRFHRLSFIYKGIYVMTNPDFIFGLTPGDLVYDIETYPNVFTMGVLHRTTRRRWLFEISFRRDDLLHLCWFLEVAQQQGCRMIGFNNLGFDYPVIHFIYVNRHAFINVVDVYNKAMEIINAKGNTRFSHMVWESDHIVPQIDLYKIHHFDNPARATSLKVLEFNMRMDNIEDLPFPVGTLLDYEQINILIHYMWHDIDATDKFADYTTTMIQFREELGMRYDMNFINHSDKKIGTAIFTHELEKAQPGSCYRYVDGKRKVVQTERERIDIAQVILPYVKFENPEFQRILIWFQSQVITETKGVFKDVNCTIDGFQFDFGTGGIHGSVESQTVYSDDYWVIEDWDVAGFYPSMGAVNNLYPEHLGSQFCVIDGMLKDERAKHPKGTPLNTALKLCRNGAYGDSNNKYSPFFDPQYTMSITINGQLLLCMLAEQLMKLDELSMIQINTDGLTVRYPRQHRSWVHQVCAWWEQVTRLELEHAEYSRMFIRDVNNYIAEYRNGDIKRKGAYVSEPEWHKDHSALIVPKAAEAALVHGKDIRTFIMGHTDVYNFFLRAKVPRATKLLYGGDEVSNIVRYYISTKGKILEKLMPAAGPIGEYKRASKLTDAFFNSIMAEIGDSVWDERIHTKNKSVYEKRTTRINTGWTVNLCNAVPTNDICFYDDLNYEWYIKEAEKLVKPLMN